MEKLLTLADIAKKLGVTRQAVSERYRRGKWLPEPDYHANGRAMPLWKSETIKPWLREQAKRK